MNKQQEPRLRFKGFSGEWKEKYLDDIGEFSAGGDLKKEKLTLFGRYPVLANALTNNGIVGFYDDYEFESPAITITGRGDVGIAKARKENFSAVVRLLVLKNKPNYDVDFLEQAINNIDFHIESTGVPQLTVPQCKSYSIYLPSEPEQTHLGLFFRRLDSQIAESRAVLEKSRQLKKAMLAKMFPANDEKIPKLRFKGFKGEWECRKFSEVAELRRGLTYSPLDISQNGIRVLRYSNIDEEYYIEKSDDVFVCEHAVNIPLVQNGDILITAANGSSRLVGKHAIIQTSIPAVHGGFMLLARTENPYFLNASMSSAWYLDFIRIFVAGGNGAIGNLSIGDLNEQEILIPKNPEEQTAIGNFFRQLDETIALQSAEVEKLNQLKKGLLAAMLV